MALMGHMKVTGLRHWTLLNGLKKKIDVLSLVLPMSEESMYFWRCQFPGSRDCVDR